MGDTVGEPVPAGVNESESLALRIADRAVEAWLRRTRDELNVQEARHPRLFVSRKAAA